MNTNDVSHNWVEERLAAYVAGGLDADEQRQLEAHVRACPACAAKKQETRDMDATLNLIGGGPARGFEDRLIAGVKRASRWRGTAKLRPQPWQVRAAGAIAASVALAAAGAMFTGDLGRNFHAFVLTSPAMELATAAPVSRMAPWEARGAIGRANPAFPRPEFQDRVSRATGSQSPPMPSSPILTAVPRSFDGTAGLEFEAGRIAAGGGKLTQANIDIHGANDGPKDDFSGSLSLKTNNIAPGTLTLPLHTGVESSTGLLKQYGEVLQNQPFDVKQYADKGSFDHRRAIPDSIPRHTPSPSAALGVQKHDMIDMQTGQESIPMAAHGPADTEAIHQGAITKLDESTGVPTAVQPPTPPPAAPAPLTPASTVAATAARKIIRNGTVDFEVDSFDSAFLQISKIAAEEQGVVTSNDSEKLPNGKVRGTVVVRVPPEHLDTLVLKLRGIGDLKGQHIASEDITKQYTDTESQLRAARAMQERLLDIIKTGKGEVKDLVAAEKELGNWREKIEKYEGEIRYYNNLVSLSTLTITLNERDIRSAAFATQQENADVGVEADDVEKSYRAALATVQTLKGRVTESQLNQLDAGQFAARLVCDVAPDQSGILIDRLRQLGRVARLDVRRSQTTKDGADAGNVLPSATLKVEEKPTRFNISFYNLTTVAPRQTTSARFACDDVEAVYKSILARVEKAGGRVLASNLNRQRPDETTGTLSFELKTDDADAVLADLKTGVDVMSLTVGENPDTNNVTTAKRGFMVSLVPLAQVGSRETHAQMLAAADVPETYNQLLALARDKGAHIIASQMNAQDARNVAATLDVEFSRTDQLTWERALADAGQTITRNVSRAGEDQNSVDTKVRTSLSLISADAVAPRETTTLSVEVKDVDKAVGDVTTDALAAGGKVVGQNVTKDASGRAEGRVVIEVPRDKSAGVLTHMKDLGTVRSIDRATSNDVPEGRLSRSRFDLTVATGPGLVADDGGVWATVRHGLSTSVAALLWSLNLIIVGLFVVGPWILVTWLIWRILKRRKRGGVTQAA